jgi:hypothetical protein
VSHFGFNLDKDLCLTLNKKLDKSDTIKWGREFLFYSQLFKTPDFGRFELFPVHNNLWIRKIEKGGRSEIE